MSNITFGPAEMLRYMGMGTPESIAAGGKRFQADFASLLPPATPQVASPAVNTVAQAMMPTDPRRRQRLAVPGPQGMGGILGMATPFGR